MPFRLAKSGSQRGIDGKFDQTQISFETKRYSDKIKRSELLTNIADLARGCGRRRERRMERAV